MSQDEYDGLQETQCNLGNELRKDFIEGLVSHHDYTEEEANLVWEAEGDEYSSKIYDCISNEIIETINRI